MAQQVEKLGTQFGPTRKGDGIGLAKQWRGLNRAATFVACLTAPAVYLWMVDQHNARWWMAALGTLLCIAAFRGLVDIFARRVIPWPNLFGADTALLQEDVVSRRRAWYWRGKFRLADVRPAGVRDRLGVPGDPLRPDGTSRRFPASSGAGCRRTWPRCSRPRRRSRSSILMLANVGILIGPFLLMAIRQIKAYEPGDANWGVKLEHVRGQKEAKERDHPRDQPLAGGRRVQEGRRQARARPAVPRLSGHRQDDAREGDRDRVQLAVRDRSRARASRGMFIGMDILAVQYLGWKAKKLAAQVGRPVHRLHRRDRRRRHAPQLARRRRLVAARGLDNIHDHLLLRAERRADAPPAIVTLKSSAWRERMFAEREGTPDRG